MEVPNTDFHPPDEALINANRITQCMEVRNDPTKATRRVYDDITIMESEDENIPEFHMYVSALVVFHVNCVAFELVKLIVLVTLPVM